MHSDAGDTTQLVPGYPIRTPWDHSSVDSSPRPIAASHVLHRLLVPRHPPSALSNLTTKMLASTMQHSNNTQPHTHTHHQQPPQDLNLRPCADLMWWASMACPRQQPHSAGLFSQDPTGCRTPQQDRSPPSTPEPGQYSRSTPSPW